MQELHNLSYKCISSHCQANFVEAVPLSQVQETWRAWLRRANGRCAALEAEGHPDALDT